MSRLACPETVTTLVVGWLAALTLVSASLAAFAAKVMQNAADIKAAWAKLHEHEAALNGKGHPPP